MELFLARIFDGLSNGSTYALIAMALVMIFKATTLINFAQGEFAMFGGFIVWVLATQQGIPMWGAVILGMLISAVAAAGIERTLIRPFDPADHLPLVIITLGLFLMINAIAGIVWRFDPQRFPELFPSGSVFSIGNASLSWYTVFTLITVAVVAGGLTLLLNKTKIGLAFRAVSSNLESSELVGIKVGPTLQFGWAIAAAVGTLGVCVFVAAPIRQLEPSVMVSGLIFAVSAAALGGLDSLGGSIIGGLAIGLVQSIAVPYLRIPNELSLGAAVVVLMLVLLFKPSGLFGTPQVERV
ncbi:branched-chain amino acid ABC transporter permease [Ilumatobacter coccineus]|jgi:branched-chain amino acid transport system permease protein|uniref:Putative branched-chain amino acid ABC transporter ATP-binding protein n=1 Tax=Ilumatobacter coccineus (strain NBRC 103263 / KCTC 29153 / YM16-304) TaxID=1313172 RepID=A0A6C7EE00_ILUCY|nr:branched-chain amino acid ABC transporter permease [Ilumatobacter coccineus]BAN03389.1 putative branched-chain amino acid ABC transporter ATP-binding protein [Ilumatobacter coccineus YM16-304]